MISHYKRFDCCAAKFLHNISPAHRFPNLHTYLYAFCKSLRYIDVFSLNYLPCLLSFSPPPQPHTSSHSSHTHIHPCILFFVKQNVTMEHIRTPPRSCKSVCGWVPSTVRPTYGPAYSYGYCSVHILLVHTLRRTSYLLESRRAPGSSWDCQWYDDAQHCFESRGTGEG